LLEAKQARYCANCHATRRSACSTNSDAWRGFLADSALYQISHKNIFGRN
jgi:hypothetical protein